MQISNNSKATNEMHANTNIQQRKKKYAISQANAFCARISKKKNTKKQKNKNETQKETK